MEALFNRLASSTPFLAFAILFPIILTIIFYESEDNESVGRPFIGKELGSLRTKQKAWMADGRGMMRAGYLKVRYEVGFSLESPINTNSYTKSKAFRIVTQFGAEYSEQFRPLC